MNKTEFQQLIQMQKDSDYLKKSYEDLKKCYQNEFVAIKDGNVIAHHQEMDKILNLIQKKRIDPTTVLIEFLHPSDMILIL